MQLWWTFMVVTGDRFVIREFSFLLLFWQNILGFGIQFGSHNLHFQPLSEYTYSITKKEFENLHYLQDKHTLSFRDIKTSSIFK